MIDCQYISSNTYDTIGIHECYQSPIPMPPFIYTDKAPSKLHPDNPVRNVYIMSFQDRYGKDECLALKAVSIIDAENNKRYRTFKYNNFFIPNPGTTFSYTFGTANGDMSAAYRPLIIRWKIDKECKR